MKPRHPDGVLMLALIILLVAYGVRAYRQGQIDLREDRW